MSKAESKPAAKPAAQTEAAKPVSGFDRSKVKVLGHIVVPSLSIKGVKTGDTMFVKFLSEIQSKEQTETEGVNAGKVKMDPKTGKPSLLHVVNATNLESGEFGQLVLPAIVHSSMAGAGKLTGRCFAWTKGVEATGKATKWAVVEIEG